jgi:NADH-quinone oxidoreductase subunit G
VAEQVLKIEIDGRPIEVPHGATVMEAANRLGVYVPHFCYHKKLSIAANCRMCLVQVEKAPKPLPACATPVTDGMKVWTESDYARKAQRGVMEFLLINHPLDCPICDQGGECQLQDLAVGYGGSASRYEEAKRVVPHKELGPLVAAEEMTRCIHCTRCVRFGQEIAGIMELGLVARGEHAEIVSFVGRSVDSELSGNMIDICPVGALTSKPFRFTARTWELARRKSISPHCGLGSNLIVQTQHERVMRVLPLENEALNECWLSDKDRFSYEGLNSQERLTRPMLKQGGEWLEVDWHVALEYAAHALRDVKSAHGGDAIGALGSPHATLEELFLLQKLARGLGSDNTDFRLRQADFTGDGHLAGAPWLGMKVADLGSLDRVLVVGSFLRKDHPLIAHRLRQSAKRGQEVSIVHVAGDDLLIKTANNMVVAPSRLATALAQIVRAVADQKQADVPGEVAGVQVGDEAAAIARSLVAGQSVGIFLGNSAQQHPHAAQLHVLVQALADTLGARFGFLGEAANSVGGYLAGCVPGANGLNASAMLSAPRKAYVLLNVEPELDCHDPGRAVAAMHAADVVVAMSAYRGFVEEYADVLLPIAPFTETSGTFVNTEGRPQSFNGVVRALGDARPGWKVLRVLGNLLGIQGFDYESIETVRAAAFPPEGFAAKLDNRITGVRTSLAQAAPGLQRVADVPIYFADPIVRHAISLQQTHDARPPEAFMNSASLNELGLTAGQQVRVRQGTGDAVVSLACDDRLADGCVRLAAAHASTARLGGMFDALTLEPA